MNAYAHDEESDARKVESPLAPTPGQVVARTLPTVALTVFGFPVLTWLVVDSAGEVQAPWWPLALMAWLGLIAISLQTAQRSWSRLDKKVDKGPLKRAHTLASESGKLPEDPSQRSAAGTLACLRIVTAISATSFALGAILAAFVRPQFPGWTLVVLAGVLAVFHLVRAEPGWHYLKALRAPSHGE